jgi:DNA-binding response OmpR family regulator
VLDTAIRLGALKTLSKPFEQDELLALVNAVLTLPPTSGSQAEPAS